MPMKWTRYSRISIVGVPFPFVARRKDDSGLGCVQPGLAGRGDGTLEASAAALNAAAESATMAMTEEESHAAPQLWSRRPPVRRRRLASRRSRNPLRERLYPRLSGRECGAHRNM